jgi:hypothetical protein
MLLRDLDLWHIPEEKALLFDFSFLCIFSLISAIIELHVTLGFILTDEQNSSLEVKRNKRIGMIYLKSSMQKLIATILIGISKKIS